MRFSDLSRSHRIHCRGLGLRAGPCHPTVPLVSPSQDMFGYHSENGRHRGSTALRLGSNPVQVWCLAPPGIQLSVTSASGAALGLMRRARGRGRAQMGNWGVDFKMRSGTSWWSPRDQTHISYVSCIGRWALYHLMQQPNLTSLSILC